MKNLNQICIMGGIAALAVAVILRLLNLQPLIHNPVTGLWKVCVALLLVAIAIGVNKK